MPNDSFNSKDEINIINKLLSKLSRSILDDIDDKIEVLYRFTTYETNQRGLNNY